MGRINEVDIMHTLTYKPLKNVFKLILAYFFTLAAVTDFIILTVNAAEIAARKENGAGARFSRKRGLLPHMQGGTGGAQNRGFSAESLAFRTVYAAGTRT